MVKIPILSDAIEDCASCKKNISYTWHLERGVTFVVSKHGFTVL